MSNILGGHNATVRMRDGTEEQVVVRQLPLSAMFRYSQVQDDDAAHLELLCDKPSGWGDTVAEDSVDDILRLGDEQNADFFGRWLRRRSARLTRISAMVQPASTHSAPISPSAPDSPSAS